MYTYFNFYEGASVILHIAMSMKRKSDECHPSGTKRCSSTVQLSLDRFLKRSSNCDGVADTNNAPVITPEYFGIRIYTTAEIQSAEGFEKAYRSFWNEKALSMCLNKFTRVKLSQDKLAVHGAINTSWTLHKVDLLELKAEEMKRRILEVFSDKVTALRKISSIEKNVARMRASATAINSLYSEAEANLSHSSLERIEDATSKELTELRKSQEALIKAMKRKEMELQVNQVVEAEKILAEPHDELSIGEMQAMVEDIQCEKKAPGFYNVDC